ncbi:MAG: pullulanase [Bacteroidetes bacterium]|nr:pullulanase [Bacteroidota bacterium]
MTLLHAQLEQPARLRLTFTDSAERFSLGDVIVTPAVEVYEIRAEGNDLVVDTVELPLCREYTVLVRGAGLVTVDNNPCLRSLAPDKPLGCTIVDGYYVFRLFAPRASRVRLLLFERPEQTLGSEYYLERGEEGLWVLSLPAPSREMYYEYRVDGPAGPSEMFNGQIGIGDPYAHAVVTANTWRHPARCLLPDRIPDYDWEGDTYVTIDNADLVLYEMHVRDMTVHPSSGVDPRTAGSYRGLVQRGTRGGLDYIRSLGVNAVELLPVQQFAAIEPPYQRHVSGGLYNHWNPYERNHWGYMTSYFFSPEPRYSCEAIRDEGKWNTAAPAHLNEFRDMVKAFHREGIAVIIDVVFNHTSQYDYQPLKYIDRKYYYRRGINGEYLDRSGCGNDLATEMPMVRRLIVDSVVHWLKEFHVDGFRFDLAAMIDDETLKAVREAAQAIHPGVILIAEPWGGGGYDLARFSALEMPAWNDLFRNGVKGHDPMNGRGYIFGTWGKSRAEDFGMWLLGSVEGRGGPFRTHAHALNYLESHDGYTLGDFIRIATGGARPGQVVGDLASHVRLRPDQLRIARLGAVLLLVSRGAVMLHAGQEFARSKVVAPRDIPDVRALVLDHNSYEKDDETNWINYTHADVNRDLLEYYQGLIALRRRFRCLRHAEETRYRFISADVPMAGGFVLKGMDGEKDLIVLINGNDSRKARFHILEASKSLGVLVDAFVAGDTVLRRISGPDLTVEAGCCLVAQVEDGG